MKDEGLCSSNQPPSSRNRNKNTLVSGGVKG